MKVYLVYEIKCIAMIQVGLAGYSQKIVEVKDIVLLAKENIA